MLKSTRIKVLLVVVYIVAICRQPSVSGFNLEDCKQLNATANVTCYTLNMEQFNINFSNEEHINIYFFQANKSDIVSMVLSCLGTDAEVLQISDNLPSLLLPRSNILTIDGCIPFEGIFQQLGVRIPDQVKLHRGITDVPLKRAQLSGLTKLKSLLLSGFDALDEDVLADIQNLETLDLTRIQTALPSGLLAPVGAQLTQLNMRENRMVTPTKGLFAPLQLLDTLDLSYNELITIPSGTFDQLHNLTVLDLSNNHLSHLPADAFQSLRKLQRLYIAYNRLQQLELGTFKTLTALQQLKLENNTLDIAPSVACRIFDGLDSLEYLELNNNSLSVYCFPKDMSSLTVDLSFNRVHKLLLPPGETQPRLLVSLNVRHNQLRHLSDESLQYLHDSFAQLSLAHNPWQCDKESFLWLDFLKLNSKRIVDVAEMYCSYDNKQRNVTLFKSSNICESDTIFYYQIAFATVALIALMAIVGCTFKERRNAGKQLADSDMNNSAMNSSDMNEVSIPENVYENVGTGRDTPDC
ncbi:leucine-rich repeat-containing protein 15 [Zeugodacus cucurbitae]|uniref:leucine-rich repeat-containing protein 15 n=1 Tax=Zeugodacus cucurbitae TaxID=28588 RepID=UPI0023D938EE|nr:leucine-rich repeat-containing protein 15 [Zeugodacus cucurbitae]